MFAQVIDVGIVQNEIIHRLKINGTWWSEAFNVKAHKGAVNKGAVKKSKVEWWY